VVGLKPTWSRVSRDGVIPLAWSLDCVGPMGRSTHDVALALEAIAGRDDRDPTSSRERVAAYAAPPDRDLRGLRVGLVDEMVDPDLMSPETLAATHAAVDVLRGLGAEVGRASIPLLATTRPLTSILVMAEAASHHRKWLRDRYLDYDSNTRVGFLTGAILPAGIVGQAERMRTRVTRQVMDAFSTFDVLIGPSGDAAPLLSAMPGRGAPAPALTTKASMPQTQVYNLAGNPAVSLPCGFDEQGLPLGVQLAARHFEEALLLRVAAAYEAATPWRERRPPLPA
jgi:aspartyl-tRNA(Asn)/glutamyl-tRNA(Gln) amidotransferase subunit A